MGMKNEIMVILWLVYIRFIPHKISVKSRSLLPRNSTCRWGFRHRIGEFLGFQHVLTVGSTVQPGELVSGFRIRNHFPMVSGSFWFFPSEFVQLFSHRFWAISPFISIISELSTEAFQRLEALSEVIKSTMKKLSQEVGKPAVRKSGDAVDQKNENSG